MSIALIDADSIIYKYASIYQDTCVWNRDDPDNIIATVETDLNTAIEEMEGFVEGIIDVTDATDNYVML